MKDSKLKKLTDEAITVVRSRGVNCFRLEQLMGAMNVDRSVASKIISQMKKEEFLETKDYNKVGDLNDPSNRGKRLFVVRGEVFINVGGVEVGGRKMLYSPEHLEYERLVKTRNEIEWSLHLQKKKD
jgi:hypothetical protein